MRDGYNHSPLNPIPPVVWTLVLPIVGIELFLSAAGLGFAGGNGGMAWRAYALDRFALNPQLLGAMAEAGRWPLSELIRFVTYPFVNGGFTQAVMSVVFTLALGKFVSEVFRPWAVIVVFFAAAIVGGVLYSLLPGQTFPLFGAYPATYGLIGAFTFLIWARLAVEHANRSRAFLFIGMLLSYQLVLWVVFGGPLTWVADMGGFAAGFGLSFLLVPGGPARVLARLRQR